VCRSCLSFLRSRSTRKCPPPKSRLLSGRCSTMRVARAQLPLSLFAALFRSLGPGYLGKAIFRTHRLTNNSATWAPASAWRKVNCNFSCRSDESVHIWAQERVGFTTLITRRQGQRLPPIQLPRDCELGCRLGLVPVRNCGCAPGAPLAQATTARLNGPEVWRTRSRMNSSGRAPSCKNLLADQRRAPTSELLPTPWRFSSSGVDSI
jgi:hypothetical protein